MRPTGYWFEFLVVIARPTDHFMSSQRILTRGELSRCGDYRAKKFGSM